MGSRKPMKLNLGMAPKVIFIMMLDVLATVVSFFLGLWFRYDFSFAEIRPVHMEGFLSAIGLWCVITLLVFWIFRLYNSIWAFVSTPEVFRITGAYVVLGVIGVLVFHFDGNLMPRSSMVVGFLFSFVSTVAIRFSYRGIAADSYAVTVGSDGAFTGAATCMGYALFFKENTLHKLYGSKPSDFQLTSLRCRGVAKNAARSLCVLNETLYYLSPDGVMAWDGSIPTKVSGVLDSGRLSNVQSAVGGALDGRYYLHIARAAAGEGVARLLVYDTERALWSEEDVCSYEMTSTGGQLYLWDGQALWAADPSRETDWQSTDGVEEKLNFELVTGDIGLDGAEDRYLSRLTLRLDAECGSTVTVAASYDGGPWETVAELAAQNVRRSYDMPFVPRRHGTLRLRLKGRGQITLRSIAKTVAAAKGGITGGEV